MSAPPEEAAKVRLPQRLYGVRDAEAAEEAWGLCPGRPLTGVRTLGDVIRAPGLHGRRIGPYQWEPPNILTAM